MNDLDYIKVLVDVVHTTVVATVDDDGLPVTSTMDMMDYDENGIYFLTAKGKNMYHRLVTNKYLALTGNKGEDTMSCTSISIREKVEELGPELLDRLFAKNLYMTKIYPTEESRQALTVFRIYEAIGEYFDLSKRPIERGSFSVGNAKITQHGYFVTEQCIWCKSCLAVCPQGCIDFVDGKAYIRQNNCLHCGNCFNKCPVQAIEKR